MALFDWASGAKIEAFAKALASELAAECPPKDIARNAITPRRITASVERLCQKALKYRLEHKLGIYRKARLGTALRWQLAELGYEESLVENITQRLIYRISRK